MEKLIDYLRTFRQITPNEAAIIVSYFDVRRFKTGEYLFKAGKVCRELYFITSGVLRVVATNNKGMDITHYFIGEDQCCTILQSFNDEITADDGIQACCDCEVLAISKSNLLELYKRLPLMVDLITEVNQQRMLEKIRLKNAYAGCDAVERYQVFITQESAIAYRVPLNYIASYLNITPQSLSRIRRSLI